MILAAFRGGFSGTTLFVLLLSILSSVLSCSAAVVTASPPPEPHSPIPAAAERTPSFDTVELPRLPGTIVLDDASGWREASAGSFTVLEHAPSRSTLSIRISRAARLVRPAECEADARLVRPSLPRIDPEAIIDSRPLDKPEGFTGIIVVGVDATPNGSTRGFVLAVGAAVARCFVLAFETSADGANAARVVGDRLRAATDRVVPSIELRSIDERVRPERNL
jgi:hypothetical protein